MHWYVENIFLFAYSAILLLVEINILLNKLHEICYATLMIHIKCFAQSNANLNHHTVRNLKIQTEMMFVVLFTPGSDQDHERTVNFLVPNIRQFLKVVFKILKISFNILI